MAKPSAAPTTPPTPPATSTGSGAAASGQTNSETPASAEAAPATPPAAPEPPAEFRYASGAGVPEWLVGKTATEAAALTANLYNQLLAGQGQQPSFSGQQTYQQPSTQPDFQTDPLAATRAALSGDFAARDQILGAQARALAELRYPDDFRRWGPEIDMALGQVAAAQRTPQVVDWIVRGVRGSHIDELTAENAQRHVEKLLSSGQLRSQAAGEQGGAVDNRVDFDKLPPRYASVLRNLGVTASTVDEMLRSCYPNLPLPKAREKWMAAASKGDVITDGRGVAFEHDENG